MRFFLSISTVLVGLMLLPAPARAQFVPPPLFETLLVGSASFGAVHYGEAAWGDYDRDGDFDLFITGARGAFTNPQPFSQLYLNGGDTIFLIEDAMGNTVQVPGTQYTAAINRSDCAGLKRERKMAG